MNLGVPKKLRLGVCAMKKKAESLPMREILQRIDEYHGAWIEVIIFNEKVILTEDPGKWPIVDALIAFHSKGFPMNKALMYSKLRKPFLVNDLETQANIMMRRDCIYKKLTESRIECPRYMVVDHKQKYSGKLVETEDFIECNGQKFVKPFVEKPVSADDHNIYIYFPQSSGGGGQKLFRKVKDRSSQYFKDLKTIRRDGTYIYEDFMKTEGTDIKVYAIDKDYAHAEARKSPALDGRVQRDKEGKEVRVPIILTRKEKEVARAIVRVFKQRVCGFDFLRTSNKELTVSYVCDVNGFSFVKSSQKYYEDSARILGNLILKELARPLGIPWKIPYQPDDPPVMRTTTGTLMELRCVIAVIRHGDRTPKQKIKMKVIDPRLYAIYKKHLSKEMVKKGENYELKLKHPDQMREILRFAQEKVKELKCESESQPVMEDDNHDSEECERENSRRSDHLHKYESVERVLTMYKGGKEGSPVFSGINRKVQLRLLEDKEPGQERIQLILKWGGELTTAGIMQAEQLGALFRSLYPGIDDGLSQYGNKGCRGLGFLRLHNTYRHDMKIYASDEGRVKLTAAAFAKGLLALEGELPPILQQLVKSANTDGLLDAEDKDAHLLQAEVKKRLHEHLQSDVDVNDELVDKLNPLGSFAIDRALKAIGNPRKCLDSLKELVSELVESIECEMENTAGHSAVNTDMPSGETWHTVYERWSKLLKDLYPNKEDMIYDISKVPDIYDCVKYDLQQNVALGKIFKDMNGLYFVSKCLAEVVVPQEYGITRNEKLRIAEGICLPLLKKMRADLKTCVSKGYEEMMDNASKETITRLDPNASHGIATPLRHVRTRLYFTSESHIHSLMNLIRYRGLVQNANDEQWKLALEFLSRTCEFNYMTQLVLMLYEDKTKDAKSPERFHLEIHFSPGLLPYYKGYYSFHPEAWYSAGGYRPKQSESNKESIPNRRKHNSGPPNKYKKPATNGNSSDGDTEKPRGTLINLDPKCDLNQPKISELLLTLFCPPSMQAAFIAHEELACHSPSASYSGSVTPTESNGGRESEPGCSCGAISSTPPQHNPTTRNLVFGKKLRDQLISTDVIKGIGIYREEESSDEEAVTTPAVLRTAVFARGNSAPDLKVFDCDRIITDTMINQVGKFITPLRSLETLHNGLSFLEFDQLVDGICGSKTPLPSSPDSISRENSSLSDCGNGGTCWWANFT